MTFEAFLQEKHGEEYVGTKDTLIDYFNDWLCDLEVDDWLAYGDKFKESK